MAYIEHVEYQRAEGRVRLRLSDGTMAEHDLGQFEAQEAAIVGAYETSPPFPLSLEQKLAVLEAENAALKKALIDGGKLTQVDLDAAAVAVVEVKG